MYLYYRNVLASSATLKDDLRDETMRQRVMKAAELDFRSYLRWIWDRDGTVDIWRSWCFYQLAECNKLDTLCILRFENLDSELANALGVPTVNLPRLNTSSRHPTAAYMISGNYQLCGDLTIGCLPRATMGRLIVQ